MSAAQNLALVRLLFFSILFLVRGLGSYLKLWGDVPAEFWHPNGLMLFIPHAAIPSSAIEWLFEFWRWSLPLCAAGLFYRLLAPLNWMAGFVLFNYSHSFGYQTHTYMPVILAGLPLAFSHASDTWSLDRLKRESTPRPNADYELPLFNMQLVFALVFFAAGVAKLRNGGLAWFTSDTLRNYFLRASTIYSDVHETAHRASVNIALFEWPMLTRAMAVMGVALELLAPFALWRKRFASIIILGLLAMQITIYFTIYVNFAIYLALYSCWLPVLIQHRPRGAKR